MKQKYYAPRHDNAIETTPFLNAEEAWFWFIAANDALNDGAQRSAGLGLYNRPCLPADVLTILNRLYRNRRLLRDHLLVLRHYGRRQLPPDPYHHREMRAATLWREAMEVLEDVLLSKGIIEAKNDWPEICPDEALYSMHLCPRNTNHMQDTLV